MDYVNNVFPTVLDLKCVSCVAAYRGLESSRISSKISLLQRGMKVLRVWNDTRMSN